MMGILETIAAKRREDVEERKRLHPLHEIAYPEVKTWPFEQALKGEGIAFICEVKKASPSKGVLAETFPYLQIAKEYEQAGAAAISVLTEPNWFQGQDAYLREIAASVSVPVLRKDFTIDPYQIYEAKQLGAAAVLLIAALLDMTKLREFLSVAHALGLSAIVEAHTEAEVDSALESGARIVGVNNRNLKTFAVDLNTTLTLRKRVPDDRIFISESGIRTPADMARLRDAGVDAVLIGETLMQSTDKQQTLAQLRGMP
ncbi:MAG: indole-3-glycerol phosphate synthase TrpC [Planctomycetia bacterium]|nr:indole-3-glycerol phosphate synthase TrpC [Planctomycetia bacterium]